MIIGSVGVVVIRIPYWLAEQQQLPGDVCESS